MEWNGKDAVKSIICPDCQRETAYPQWTDLGDKLIGRCLDCHNTKNTETPQYKTMAALTRWFRAYVGNPSEFNRKEMERLMNMYEEQALSR